MVLCGDVVFEGFEAFSLARKRQFYVKVAGRHSRRRSLSKRYNFAASIRLARKRKTAIPMSTPVSGPTRQIHHPLHCPETIAGPRLRAGFVLVHDIGDSAYTMMAYKNGNSACAYGRGGPDLRKIHNPAIKRKVVITSPRTTSATV